MEKVREIECPVCHKKFTTAHHSQKYCSKDCHRLYKQIQNKEQYQEKQKRKKKKTALNDIAAAALAEGLTYGQYVAKYNL